MNIYRDERKKCKGFSLFLRGKFRGKFIFTGKTRSGTV